MDFAEAEIFSESVLRSGPIGGWRPSSLLSYGKSAIVMLAQRDEAAAVVKVFHPGLLERYGREAQLVRVNRERELVERRHPNLVPILDAGCCGTTGHVFVVMAHVPGRPLSKLLSEIPRKNIAALVEQLASAAKQLEDWGFTHRDIKPDNIHIVDDELSSLVLLDFGVLKPHGDDTATSQHASSGFIGTHQYSPPEFIHGHEEDTLNGWRAVTFYQIGAVLHDLIARKPIFGHATTRGANLVTAIDNEDVVVKADDVDDRLCNLATRCLLKNPLERLELVQWEDFNFSNSQVQQESLNERTNALIRQLQVNGTLRRKDPIENAEARRLKELRLAGIVRSARAQFDQALVALGDLAPPRTTIINGGAHPNVAVTYTFTAAPSIGLDSPFRIQLAVGLHDDRSTVDVYARGSKGLGETEVGWTHIRAALESLDGVSSSLQEWTLTIVEELARQ